MSSLDSNHSNHNFVPDTDTIGDTGAHSEVTRNRTGETVTDSTPADAATADSTSAPRKRRRSPAKSRTGLDNPPAASSSNPTPRAMLEPIVDYAPRVRTFIPETDLAALSLDELSTSDVAYNRELSWLDFNWRVLAEATDDRNPLLERLKFIAITAGNLDEFFRKRVGGLRRQKAAGIAHLNLPGWTPDRQLQLISKAVRPMIEEQAAALHDQILPALAENGVHIVDYAELDFDQQQRLRAYYLREVYPILTPLAVDPGHPFPFLSNLSLSLGIFLHDPLNDETQFARVKLPQNRPRWVPLEIPYHFVPLEQVIIHNLDALFIGMDIVAAYPFRVTRNADMARNEEEADDLMEMISEELREQRFAAVVRLEVDQAMPADMLAILQHELGLEQSDIYPVRGLLRLADLFPLADLNLPNLKFEPWTPIIPPRLVGIDRQARSGDLFSIIRQGDLLVHHPYHSFTASTQLFIETAARDPQVVAIKQTLYRTSSDSPVVEALIHAAERGKQVAVLVEVKARFDEAQNIEWARALENAGCHVAYGLVGLKTHSKLSLVVRDEEDGLRAYFHIGTGNYNPKTASLYTDLGLFSCNPDIGADIMDVFNFLTGYSRQTQYRKLLVAPVNMRQHFVELIDAEIAHALQGRGGRIIAKMNGFEDTVLVRKIYEASQAGVQIDLIVRGNSRIHAGLPNISENVRVYSVIGRFLEHSRIWYFANAGAPRYFIGSADWMRRNLSNRVEAVVPIEDPRLQEQILAILQLSLDDQRQAWEMMPDGRYRRQRPLDPENVTPQTLGTQSWLMRQARLVASQIPEDL
jgi:polyphosphate kinase